MVPRIVHQVWFGGVERAPTSIMASWRALCARHGWEYRLWTEREIDSLPMENRAVYTWFQNRGDLHGMSDVARVEILRRYGGLYCDCDFEWAGNPLEEVLPLEVDLLLATTENTYPSPVQFGMWQQRFPGGGASAHFLANGFLAAPPENPILALMIREMPESVEKNRVRVEQGFVTSSGARRRLGAADCVGCFLLTHCSRQHPFVVIPNQLVFAPQRMLHDEAFRDYRKRLVSYYRAKWRTYVGAGAATEAR